MRRRLFLAALLFLLTMAASIWGTLHAIAQDEQGEAIDAQWGEIKVWEKTEFDPWLREAAAKHEKEWRESALKKLLEERRSVLAHSINARRAKAEAGVGEGGALLAAEWALTEAELELVVRNADRVVLLKKFHEKAAKAEEEAKARADAGRTGTDGAELSEIKALRLKVEIALEREFDRGKRPSEEVEVMGKTERAHLQTFQKVKALFDAGAKGGEPDKHALSAREFLLARARLELAQGKRAEALADLKLACWFGKRCVEATQAAYDVGTITLDMLLDANQDLDEVRLEFLRTYRVFGDPKKAVEVPKDRWPGGGAVLKQAAR
jgi:hypothetical protein